MYLNLELSEWFMIKSKQQPLMSLRNLFKYLFVCELLPFAPAYVHTKIHCIRSYFIFFLLLQVTLNTFRHISACSKTKEKYSFALLFLSISQFSFLSVLRASFRAILRQQNSWLFRHDTKNKTTTTSRQMKMWKKF